MAKKRVGLLITALTVGAVAVLRNKENRQVAMDYLNSGVSKVTTLAKQMNKQNNRQTSYENSQLAHTLRDVAEAPAGTSELTIDENAMVYEGGAQTAIFQYNEEQAKASPRYH